MNNKEIFDIIGKALSNEANEQELLELHRWLSESEENARTFEQVKLLWKHTYIQENVSNADRVFRKIQEKKDFLGKYNREEATEKKTLHFRRTRNYTNLSIAAAVVLVLLMAIPVYYNLNKAVENQEVNRTLTVKENGRGQKSKITLSDGTIVWLNANSKLSYINGFTDSLREVHLEGEAYFDVAKNAKKPFVVHTGQLKTTVVGTEFNLRNYAEDSIPSLFLTEGKVNYQYDMTGNYKGILTPGNGVKWDSSTNGISEFKDDAVNWASWKDGILLFNDIDFMSALKECQRWYDVDFIVKGTPPSDWKFTGKFKNAYLESVLNSMQYGKAFNYTIDGKNIEITIN
ncbi:FecR family protein [Echinicola shivajiensis]|uniref:FecR family protein n=1 Tax=Echinicola shivajiensis TaxID=1035916 RepID=UPI001BFC5FDB|nr:FecR family protein [Echinicola shivajiensis]